MTSFANMSSTNVIARQLISILQDYLKTLGFTPVIHFELEGCYQFEVAPSKQGLLDFSLINHTLNKLNINGELIAEYWSNQWEYVSNFDGQLPLQEADNLTQAINFLPKIMAQQGG